MIVDMTPNNEPVVTHPITPPTFEAVSREAASINALVAANNGKDPLETLLNTPEVSPIETFVEGVSKGRAEQLMSRRQMFEAAQLPPEISDNEIINYKKDLSGENGALGLYRQKAIEMAGGVQDEYTDELAFALMYRTELPKVIGDVDLWSLETWGDIAGVVLIPGRTNVPLVDMARSLGFINGPDEVMMAAADPGQLLDKLHSIAFNLKPADRAEMFKDVSTYLEGVDNALVRSQILFSIFSGDYNATAENVFNTLDVAEVTMIVKGVSNVAKGVYSTGKLVNLLKKNPTIEGHRLVTGLASDPKTVALSHVTPADVADLHNPAMHGKMAVDLTGAGDDTAADIVSMLDLQDAYIKRYTETSLREGVLSPAREREVQALAEAEIAKIPYVKDVQAESIPGGFRLNYKEVHVVPDTGRLKEQPPLLTDVVEEVPAVNTARIEEIGSNIERFKKNNNIRYKIRDEEGEKVGFITGRDTDNSIRVVQSEVSPENRGKGFGIKAYTDLVDYAHSQGKILESDSVVSSDAERLYKSLEKKGYVVTKHPEARVNAEGQILAPKGEPVFKVEPAAREVKTEPPVLTDAVSIQQVPASKTVYFNVDDQGKVSANVDEEYRSTWLSADPNAKLMGQALQDYVKNAETITREQSKLIGALEHALKAAYRDLDKSSVAKVDQVVIQGSKEGREYSYKELMGMGLNAKEAKAYLGQRNVMHHLWQLENQKIIDTAKAEGSIIVKTDDGVSALAKTFDSPEQAREYFLKDDPETFSILVLDEGLPTYRKGERIDLESAGALKLDQLEEYYNRGFRLTRNKNVQGKFEYNGHRTNWALTLEKNIRAPDGVPMLNKIPGYMPKARSDSFYFVKAKRDTDASNPRMFGGKPKEIEITVAWADNLADAEKAARQMGEGHYVKFDRDLSSADRSGDITLIHGGLFTGGRKAEELPYVGSNSKFDFEPPVEMMQRYINHVGKQVPSHLWRLGNEERLLQRARQLMPNETIHNINQILPRAESVFTKGGKEYGYLKQMVEQIQNVASIPTSDEVAMAKRLERIGNSLEGSKGLSWLSKYFYRSAQNKLNIADRIKGITFTHMLGLYNPAQILIQASGSFSAFAINPVSAIKAIPKMIGWHILDGFVRDPLAKKAAADWMRSKGMKEFADSYEIWNRSGFRESVVSSNSDFATLFGNKPYDAGVLQRLAANNSIFYQMGELVTSRASVATAVEWYKDMKGIEKVDLQDAEALKQIYSRAEQYRLNMGKANPSWFNKGWQSVPFQFQQVMSKYLEKVLPEGMGGTGELTIGEKARLAAIPVAITGIAGVPGGTAGAHLVASMMGEDLNKMDPDEIKIFQAGYLGWALSEGLGLNVDFSSRMSLGTDVFKNMYDYVTGGGSDAAALVLGPSGSVLTRWTQSAQYFWNALDVVKEGEAMTTQELTVMAKVVVDALASIPSSTRNIKDYLPMILSDQKKYYKDGRFMWEWEDMNTQTALFAAFGFQPTEQIDLYNMVNAINTEKGMVRPEKLQLLKDDAAVLTRLFATGILGENRENAMALHNKFIKGIVESYDGPEQTALLEAIYTNMYTPKYEFEELFQKFRMDNEIAMDKGLQLINERVSKRFAEMGAK